MFDTNQMYIYLKKKCKQLTCSKIVEAIKIANIVLANEFPKALPACLAAHQNNYTVQRPTAYS